MTNTDHQAINKKPDYHKIRIYKGETIIGYVNIEDKYYDQFSQAFSHYGGRLEPCINMVDDSFKNANTGEWDERNEFQKVVHFDLKERL